MLIIAVYMIIGLVSALIIFFTIITIIMKLISKRYKQFQEKIKKQNRYLTKEQLEKKLNIEKGTFIMTVKYEVLQLWWTPDNLINPSDLYSEKQDPDVMNEYQKQYQYKYLDENVGVAFLIAMPAFNVIELYQNIPVIDCW